MPMTMRIESTGPAAGVASTAAASSPTAATSVASALGSASTTTAVDPATGEPVPPKYPWITRLTLELEQAAQKEKASPFKPAEVAGETLNKLA